MIGRSRPRGAAPARRRRGRPAGRPARRRGCAREQHRLRRRGQPLALDARRRATTPAHHRRDAAVAVRVAVDVRRRDDRRAQGQALRADAAGRQPDRRPGARPRVDRRDLRQPLPAHGPDRSRDLPGRALDRLLVRDDGAPLPRVVGLQLRDRGPHHLVSTRIASRAGRRPGSSRAYREPAWVGNDRLLAFNGRLPPRQRGDRRRARRRRQRRTPRFSDRSGEGRQISKGRIARTGDRMAFLAGTERVGSAQERLYLADLPEGPGGGSGRCACSTRPRRPPRGSPTRRGRRTAPGWRWVESDGIHIAEVPDLGAEQLGLRLHHQSPRAVRQPAVLGRGRGARGRTAAAPAAARRRAAPPAEAPHRVASAFAA